MNDKEAILLNYTGDEDNWGCKATSESLLNLIQERANLKVTQKVSIHYKKRSVFRYVRARIKDKLISNGLLENKVFSKLMKIYLENFSSNKNIYRSIKTSEATVLNGEGSIHNYCTAMIEWFFYLSVAKDVYNKYTTILNHTLQFDDENAKRLSRITYSKLDKVMTREFISTRNLKDIGIDNVSVTGDAAFFAEPCDDSRTLEILKGMGINGKYICLAGTVVFDEIPFDKYVKLIRSIKEKYNYPILYTASCEIDRKFISRIKSEIPDVIVFDKDYTYTELMGVIKNCEFFVTGRFHPMIFSMITQTPFIPYQSNTIKMQGVLEMTNYPVDVVDFVKVTEDDLVKKIEYVLENKQEIKSDLKNKVNEIRNTTSNSYGSIYSPKITSKDAVLIAK